jgi:hypothetical protein
MAELADHWWSVCDEPFDPEGTYPGTVLDVYGHDFASECFWLDKIANRPDAEMILAKALAAA